MTGNCKLPEKQAITGNSNFKSLFFSKTVANLKLLFHYFLILHQVITLQKLRKMLFISSKKLFLFSRYYNFWNFFPSFPHSAVRKWSNL